MSFYIIFGEIIHPPFYFVFLLDFLNNYFEVSVKNKFPKFRLNQSNSFKWKTSAKEWQKPFF